jgi:drug/metabolite transporter (DMT)-like permease
MWEFYALSATLAWAIVTLLDKVLLERHIPSGNTYLILNGFIGLLPAAGLLVLGRQLEWANGSSVALALLAGLLESIFLLLYYKALQVADASLVAILLQGVPVITLVIGLVVFQQTFPVAAYLGIALIVAGTVVAILAGSPGRPRVEWHALWIVLPALVAISVSYSLQSYTLRSINVDTFFVAARLGQLLLGLALLLRAPVRDEFVTITGKLRPAILFIAVAIGLLSLVGAYLLNEAYALGPLALVTTTSSIQPILILLMVSLVNSIRPRTIPDEGSQMFFWRRALATGFVIAGIFLASG